MRSRKRTVDLAFHRMIGFVFARHSRGEHTFHSKNPFARERVFVALVDARVGILREELDHKVVLEMCGVVEGECVVAVRKRGVVELVHCLDDEDAKRQIVKASRLVPRMEDVVEGGRVAVLPLDVTGVVVKKPVITRTWGRMGERLQVELDGSGAEVAVHLEDLRLISEQHEEIQHVIHGRGRPVRKPRTEQSKYMRFEVPPSKSGSEWKNSIMLPSMLPLDESSLYADGDEDENIERVAAWSSSNEEEEADKRVVDRADDQAAAAEAEFQVDNDRLCDDDDYFESIPKQTIVAAVESHIHHSPRLRSRKKLCSVDSDRENRENANNFV